MCASLKPPLLIGLASRVNARDLGGYPTAFGTTQSHRFVRCGGTQGLTARELATLRGWGVSRVLDLRGIGESPRLTCRLAREPWVAWKNVSLYGHDISSPTLLPAQDTNNYLVSSYLHMLGARKALRHIFSWLSEAAPKECVLFHCAAGMDRTGILAMLLLGLVEVPREQIIADYAYSFGTPDEVRQTMLHPLSPDPEHQGFTSYMLNVRIEAISTVYDALVGAFGTARAFLEHSGVTSDVLDAVQAHLLD